MASTTDFTSSPSGPFGVVKEMFAAGKILAEAKAGSQNPLVSALVAELATSEGRELAQPKEASGKKAEELLALAVDHLKQVRALLEAKAGADADDFKRWLATLGERVAQAATEGGFLGFGGTRVTDKEASALTDIRSALGVRV
jgi:hypothetical protein